MRYSRVRERRRDVALLRCRCTAACDNSGRRLRFLEGQPVTLVILRRAGEHERESVAFVVPICGVVDVARAQRLVDYCDLHPESKGAGYRGAHVPTAHRGRAPWSVRVRRVDRGLGCEGTRVRRSAASKALHPPKVVVLNET